MKNADASIPATGLVYDFFTDHDLQIEEDHKHTIWDFMGFNEFASKTPENDLFYDGMKIQRAPTSPAPAADVIYILDSGSKQSVQLH